MASAGKGLPFIGKLNEFIDRALHPTVQKVGSSRAATEVISKKYFLLNPVPTTPYVVEVGSTDNLVVVTGHNFKAGDLIRLVSTTNPIVEHEIIVDAVIDANTVSLAGYLSHNLSAGDTFNVLRPVSERVAEDGSSLSTVVSPPIQYNRVSSGITVPTTVTEDLDNPNQSRALPVVIHSIDGAPIIVNAGDLSVSTSHVNDSMAIGDGTTIMGVNPDGSINTKSIGTLSTNNSTVANLGIGAVFSGLADDCLNYGSISIAIYASHDSATLGLQFQASEDGVTWYTSDSYNYKAISGMQTYSLAPVARYFRLVYTNGATATTTLKIQVIFRQFYVKPSSHRIGDTITQENDAELTKSVLTAQKPNGDFTPIDATAAGNLKTSVEEFDTGALNWGAGNADTRTQRVILATDQVMNLPTGAATEATLATVAKETTLNSLLTAFNAEDFATSAKQDTMIASLASIAAEDFATSAKQDTMITSLGTLAGINYATETTLAAMSAKLPASLGKKADTASLSVTLATNEVLSTQERALACGTVTDLTIAGSGVTTINAPVGARGMKIQAGIDNTSDLLVGLGGATPDNTTKTGLEFQPGRSEDIQGASNVEVTAYDPAATNQKIVIVWSYV